MTMSASAPHHVAAPSKLQKPTGDRVETDARDTLHPDRLLCLDEITAVAIPTVEQESARDLVRARKYCRGDLMRAHHRLSKLRRLRAVIDAAVAGSVQHRSSHLSGTYSPPIQSDQIVCFAGQCFPYRYRVPG